MPCSLQLYGDLIMCTSDVSAIVSQGPFQCEKLIQPPSEHRPACHHATAPHSSLAQICVIRTTQTSSAISHYRALCDNLARFTCLMWLGR
jgi:hypothetical protein